MIITNFIKSRMTNRKITGQTAQIIIVTLFSVSVCFSASKEKMNIAREVVLSPGHAVMPYLLSRLSNGDYIVAGSSDFDDSKPWAVRLDASGKVLWEYLDHRATGWNDYSVKSQRFFGIVELPEQSILLCGVRRIENHQTAFLVRLGVDGSLLDERPLRPANNSGHPSGLRCIRWGDGIAVLGGLSGEPAGTGWLTKLSRNGDWEWEKFAEYLGYGDVIEAKGGGLFIICEPNRETSIARLGINGEMIARHSLAGEDWSLVHPRTAQSTPKVAIMLSTPETEIMTFDEQLRGPIHIGRLHNAGVKKALEQPDGSVVIFGSKFLGGATASISVLYKGGNTADFLLEPAHQSAWFFDAVPTDEANQFAAVRTAGKVALLDWISIE